MDWKAAQQLNMRLLNSAPAQIPRLMPALHRQASSLLATLQSKAGAASDVDMHEVRALFTAIAHSPATPHQVLAAAQWPVFALLQQLAVHHGYTPATASSDNVLATAAMFSSSFSNSALPGMLSGGRSSAWQAFPARPASRHLGDNLAELETCLQALQSVGHFAIQRGHASNGSLIGTYLYQLGGLGPLHVDTLGNKVRYAAHRLHSAPLATPASAPWLAWVLHEEVWQCALLYALVSRDLSKQSTAVWKDIAAGAASIWEMLGKPAVGTPSEGRFPLPAWQHLWASTKAAHSTPAMSDVLQLNAAVTAARRQACLTAASWICLHQPQAQVAGLPALVHAASQHTDDGDSSGSLPSAALCIAALPHLVSPHVCTVVLHPTYAAMCRRMGGDTEELTVAAQHAEQVCRARSTRSEAHKSRGTAT